MGRTDGDRTAVMCVGCSVRWDEVARIIPETVLVAEPRLPCALEWCFLGSVDRLVVDLADCDAPALSALAHLHRDRPEQEILLLHTDKQPALLQQTSLADLPVAVVRRHSDGYGPGASSRYSRITGPVGDSGST